MRRPPAGVMLFGAREGTLAAVAQPVERVLGKDEVMGPIPISSSFVGRSKNFPRGRSVRPIDSDSSNRSA